jgi:3-methylcrotonyl-CoA carboxylase alpha subunit
MERDVKVTVLGDGLYRVADGDRRWTVAVAGPADNRWVWIDGRVLRIDPPRSVTRARGSGPQDLSAPMPATVVRVTVGAGDRVARGDTLLILEAMKMELPIHAPRDGIVKAVHCQPGELVQPGVNLIDIE